MLTEWKGQHTYSVVMCSEVRLVGSGSNEALPGGMVQGESQEALRTQLCLTQSTSEICTSGEGEVQLWQQEV